MRYDWKCDRRELLRAAAVAVCGVALGPQAALAAGGTDRSPPSAVDPNALVLQAVTRAVWGPTLRCRVQQETNMFGQQMIGIGQYAHGGGGDGAVKTVMRFTGGKGQSTFVQVSDGRLLWSIASDGTPPKRVYLDRVRQSLGGIARTPQSGGSVSLYLAIGGQAELFRTLYHRYRWYKIYAAEIAGEPVWQLVGTLRTNPPDPHAVAPVDLRALNPQPHPSVPTDVRLTMFRGGQRDLAPLRLEYFARTLDDRGQLTKFEPVSKIEYSDVTAGVHIDESEFVFDGEAVNNDDETGEYMPPPPPAAVAAAPVPPIR